MKKYSLDWLRKKGLGGEFFRRGLCLLLALLMVLPTAGGVFAANGEDLVNEAFVAIDKAHKTDIARVNSAIWWINEGGQEKIVDSDTRTKAIFLSALLERLLGYKNTLIDTPPAKVEVEVLGTKYTISVQNPTTTTSPSFPGDDEAEKFQIQFQIDKLVKEINAAGGVLARLDGFIKELEPTTSTVTAVRLKEIEAKVIGCDKEIQKYDEEVRRLTIQAIGVSDVDFTHLDYALYLLKNKVVEARLKIVQRNEKLEEDAKEASKKMIQDELDKIVIKINEGGGALITLGVYLGELKGTGTVTIDRLKEMEAKLVEYRADVKSYEDRVKELKRLAEAPPEVDGINYSDVDFAIVLLGNKITDVEEELAPKLTAARIEEAKAAVAKAEKDKTNADVTGAKKAVDFLEDGNDKTDLTNRIAYVKQIIKAIAAVDKAVKSKKADDYGVADALVNGTGNPKVGGLDEDTGTAPRDIKNDLNDKLAELKVIIDADAKKVSLAEAAKAVTGAETALNKYADDNGDADLLDKALENAVDKINEALKNDVPHDTGDLYVLIIKVGVSVADKKATKDLNKGFHLRAREITEVITAIENKEAEILGKIDLDENTGLKSVTKDSLSTVVQGRIQYLGKGLNTRIDDIYKVIDAIAGFDATNIRTLADVKAARAIVTKLSKKFELTKAILNAEITKREEAIKSNLESTDAAEAIKKAYDAVIEPTATSPEIAALIKAAKTLIGKETDNIEKIKLTAVINAIETAQKAKEAVALADATKLRKDFNKADSLVKSISEDDLEYITGDSKNLTELKSTLSAQLESLLKIINLAEATAAVVKAENSLNQKDYDLAFTAIGKVDGDIDDSSKDKGKLKDRLDIVKSVIDATNAVAKAVSAVGDAAKSSKELDNSKKIESAEDALIEADIAVDNAISLDEISKYKINTDTMTATVNDLKKIYIVAVKAVKLLSDVQQESDTSVTYDEALKDAKLVVGMVTDSKVRSDLESGITAIESRHNMAGSVNKAEEKLINAEEKLNTLLLLNNMDSGSYKPIKDLDNFSTEIEEIKMAIADADAEIKTIKDKRATEFKNRLLAVIAARDVAILIAKAEGKDPLVKAEVDAATKALPKVKEDIIKDGDGKTIINHKEIKTYFEARVEYLNINLVKAQQFAEAKKLTDKAYETLSEGDIKKAIEYVAKMQDKEDKIKFNKGALDSSPRIYGIDTILEKFATDKVEGNISLAISGLQMDLKSGAKPVGDAKKSTDVFSNLVKLANSRLGEGSLEPPTGTGGKDLIKYAEEYAGAISEYNTNNTALAKAQQVWQQIAKADKSKSPSDIERLDIEFGLLGEIVEGIEDELVKNKYYMDKTGEIYTGGLLGSLYGEITKIKNFQEGEAAKKADADNAIAKVIATLKAYTEATDANGKKTAREQLPVDIGEVRKAVAKIDASDKTAHKEYNAEISLMELYRDAINKINRAQISCTPANVKDAKAAVDKADKAKDNGDYIFVNVVLAREVDELYERLINEESAEKAKILVDKAWETKMQTDWDAANNAVTRLPENNEAQTKIKNDLLKSLEELKKVIDNLDETDRKAVTEAEKALKEALTLIYESKIQEVDPTEKQINDAYAKLTGRGIDGESYEDTEGTHFAEYYIKEAKDSANKIVRDLDGKNALLGIIAEREHLLKVYSEEILIKEARRLIVIADASVILRNSMPKDTPEERKAWEKQTVKANGDLDSAAIAIKRINLPENFDARQRLLERLGLITKDLNTGTTTDKIAYINGLLREATKRVSDARDVFEKGDVDVKLLALLTDAKNLVGDIEIEIEMLVVSNESEQSAKDKLKELVAALRQNLTNIENGISDKDLIANAEKAIKAAEDRVKKKEYESAKVDIMEAEMNTEQISDTNAIKRNELRSKINKLKNEISEATGGEETPPLDDQNDPKVIAKALQLYYKAKASLLQKDIDAARKYINENMVHNTTLKQWLLAKLAELEKIIVGINKPGDIEEEKRKEEEAKKKAEEARKKKYPGIDDALDSKKRDTSTPDAKWGKENEFKKK